MKENLLNTIYLAGAFLALFTSAELFYKFKVKAEVTRKYVHVVTGLLAMLFPLLIQNHWLVLALCGSFLIILLSSQALNLLPSINAVYRKTRGGVLFPIIVYGCYLIYMEYDRFMFYYIPILILTFCDPVAALIGKRWPIGKYKTFGQTKTLSGSLGFFITATITSLCLIWGLEEISVGKAIAISVSVAIATTVAEAITYKGYDNLTVPVSALVALILLNN